MPNRSFFAIFSIWVILSITILGCNNVYKEQFEQSGNNLGERNMQDRNEQNGSRAYGLGKEPVTNKNIHQNKKLHLNQYTSTQIGRMEGVAVAHVFIADRNAYVGMILDNTATGHAETGTGRKSEDPLKSPAYFNGRDQFLEIEPGHIVDDYRKKFTYPNSNQISSKLQQKVAKKIRELNPQVEHVFISANADFINELNVFAIRYWSGESLDKYADDFNELVERYFPIRKSPNDSPND